MKNSSFSVAAGGIVVSVLGLGAFAQQQTPAQSASTKTFDELFVQAAAAGNAFEIETSRLAPEHANSASVKKFAAMMVEMHTKAQNDLNSASTKGATANTPSSSGEMTNNAPNSGSTGPGGSAPGTPATQPGGNPVAPSSNNGATQNQSRVGSSSNNQSAKPAAPTYVAMLSPGEQLQLTYLGTLKGAAFDRAYANAQINAHEGALIVYKLASGRASDSNLKAFATKTVAVVQQHLKDITAISKTIK